MNTEILKSKLEIQIGFRIDSIASCRRLEQLLYDKGFFVSYTTLSRMFGLASISSKARSSTFDVLTNFLGFDNYHQFDLAFSEKENVNREKVASGLELEALLIRNEPIKAIDYLISLKKTFPSVFLYNSQIVCKYLFGHVNSSKKNIDYLLSFEDSSLEILQFFVYEDDPFGHYGAALKRLYNQKNESSELLLFDQLFHARKDVLKGSKKKFHYKPSSLSNFHLSSRALEINLLANQIKRNGIIQQSEEILFLLSNEKNLEVAFAYVGRWCRGLIYTEKYLLLTHHSAWKEQCIALIQTKEINKEFQAIIYTFLTLTYGYIPSLDFMFQNNWENAKIESQLLLSLAFKNKTAFETYKKSLGYL